MLIVCTAAKISDEKLMNRIETVQECDARGDAIIFYSWAHKNKILELVTFA
jgi:hypothetical protein